MPPSSMKEPDGIGTVVVVVVDSGVVTVLLGVLNDVDVELGDVVDVELVELVGSVPGL